MLKVMAWNTVQAGCEERSAGGEALSLSDETHSVCVSRKEQGWKGGDTMELPTAPPPEGGGVPPKPQKQMEKTQLPGELCHLQNPGSLSLGEGRAPTYTDYGTRALPAGTQCICLPGCSSHLTMNPPPA